jgi:RecG-like helicase
VHGLVKGAEPTGNGHGPGYDEANGTEVMPIGSLTGPGRAAVEGRVRVVEIKPVERNSVLSCEISDGTGQLTAMFYGRSHIPGIVCGARVRFRGSVGMKNGHPVMINPAYELLFPSVLLVVPGTRSS